MPDTQLASSERIAYARSLWFYAQQTRPNEALKKYVGLHGNPLTDLTPSAEAIEEFIRRFPAEVGISVPAERLPDTVKNSIDAKKRDELVAEFEKHKQQARQNSNNARARAKDFNETLFRNAKNSALTPTPDESQIKEQSALPALTTQRVDDAIRFTMEEPIPLEQKKYFFQTLEDVSAHNPHAQVVDLIPRAKAVAEVGHIMATTPPTPTPTSFKELVRIGGGTSFQKLAAPLVDTVTSVFGVRAEALTHALAKPLKQTLENTDMLTRYFGENVVDQLWYRQALADVNRMSGASGAGKAFSGIGAVVSDVGGSIISGPPTEGTMAVFELYHMYAIQGGPPPSLYQVHMASMGPGAGLLQIGTGLAVQKVAGGFFSKIWALAGSAFGPVGTAAGAVASKVVGDQAAEKMSGAVTGFFGFLQGDMIQGLLRGDFKPSFWASMPAVVAVVIIGAVLLVVSPLPLFFGALVGTPNFRRIVAYTNFFVNIPAGGGEYTGPTNYSGPLASGPIQCLNYNTTLPFSTDQHDIMEKTIKAYPQLGLYNCVLQCPTHQINMHSYNTTSSSGYWGYAPGQGDLFFYLPTFTASEHARARLLAHELGHQLAYAHPEIFDAFKNGSTQYPRGYCGCLGTYHFGGKLPNGCYTGEIVDETFAEAAAMYLTGENLQSLCQPAYNFMSVVFNQCSTK